MKVNCKGPLALFSPSCTRPIYTVNGYSEKHKHVTGEQIVKQTKISVIQVVSLCQLRIGLLP